MSMSRGIVAAGLAVPFVLAQNQVLRGGSAHCSPDGQYCGGTNGVKPLQCKLLVSIDISNWHGWTYPDGSKGPCSKDGKDC